MRLAYLPEVLPDELLYSVLARLARHTGGGGPGATMRTLFGKSTSIASLDLPNRLAALAARIDPARAIDAEWLIDRTTLFPYYTAFSTPAIAAAVRVAMRTDGGSVHLRLGVAASRVRKPGRLRYCVECAAAMSRDHGERYWRRSHQLPGIVVCPEHMCVLSESAILLAATNRHEFIAADARSCPVDGPRACDAVAPRDIAILASIARESERILAGDGEPSDLSHAPYRAQLARIGLMRSDHRVDQVALAARLWETYGDGLRHLPSTVRDGRCGEWLPEITRFRRKALHPLFHAVLRSFLAGERTSGLSPFGQPPWQCRNVLADHYGRSVVMSVRHHRNRLTRVAVFECACGYAYTRCSHGDGRVGPPRYQSYGPLLEPALRRLVVPGAALRSVARDVALDPKTLLREMASLGIASPWACRASGRARSKRSEPSVPERRCKSRDAPLPRIDWAVLDLQLVERLAREAAAIRDARPPLRVTPAEMERRLGRRGWLGKRRAKLPLATRQLTALTEELAAFKLRRIEWIIARELRGGSPVVPWKVMRAAGLASCHMPVIEAAIKALAFLESTAAVKSEGFALSRPVTGY